LTTAQTYLPALSPAGSTGARPASSSASYLRPSKAEDWEPYREVITTMYATKTLAVVMDSMEKEYGFRATLKQYKIVFKKWGLDNKYIKGTEYSAMVQARRDRSNASPPKDTVFTLRGQTVDPREIDRFERRATRNGTLQGMLDELASSEEPVAELTWKTPSPTRSSPGGDAAE